jgi:hypothetical protein
MVWIGNILTPEKERVAFWLERYPSGFFMCHACGFTYGLVAHRARCVERQVARNRCLCGSPLASCAFDYGDVSALHPRLPEEPVDGTDYRRLLNVI